MPRNGSGVYSHPFPDVVEGTTIESAVFNGNTSDVEQDLNTPRPIVAGGTGANNAHDAMIALSGEIAVQAVTNYDSYAFVDGSFYSSPGATSEPTAGQAYVGICYGAGIGAPIIEARGLNDGVLYVRRKLGTWGSWLAQAGSAADLDAAYVNVAGDTMTGPLSVEGAVVVQGSGQPALHLKSTGAAAGNQRMSFLYDGGAVLGQPGIVIQNQADAGGFVGNSGVLWRDGALTLGASIARPNGGAGGLRVDSTVGSTSPTTGALTVAGGVGVGGRVTFGDNNGIQWGTFGSTVLVGSQSGMVAYTNGGVRLTITDAGLNVSTTTASGSPTTGALTVAGGVGIGGSLFTGGSIVASGPVTVGGASTATVYWSTSGTRFINFDGTNYNVAGGPFNVIGGALNITNGNIQHQTSSAYALVAGFGYSFGYGGSTQWGFNFRPNNDAAHNAMVFSNAGGTGIGSIAVTSTTTAFNTTSSAELKEDLKTFDAGSIIDNTEVYDFKWKSSSERAYGVLAQQAVEIYPTAVTHLTNPENKDDEFWGVDYSKYVPVLLQELKALRARVFELEGRVGVGTNPA